MLKSIDPLLSGDLLKCLADLGHGDELAVVDRNYPSYRHGLPVMRFDGVGIAAMTSAILSVFPLDSFVSSPIVRMEIDGDPDRLSDVHSEVHHLAAQSEGRDVVVTGIERTAFYDLVSGAAAIVHTGETEGYSCFLLRKGVV